MEISTWISFGSLIVALAALLWTGWQQRQINRHTLANFQEKELQRKQALVRACGYKAGNNWIVRVTNDGLAPARNIRFEAIDHDPCITLTIEKGLFPFPILNSGDSFEIRAILAFGHNAANRIAFTWDDESCNNRKREQTLTFTQTP